MSMPATLVGSLGVTSPLGGVTTVVPPVVASVVGLVGMGLTTPSEGEVTFGFCEISMWPENSGTREL